MRRTLPLAVLAACAACAAGGGALPLELDDLPGRGPTDAACWQARALWEAGRGAEALEMVARLLEEVPGHTDAERLRQDIFGARGRRGRLLWEAERRLAAAPDLAQAHYLRGRIAREDDEKLESFRRAIELRPESFWGWLGTAFALRTTDPDGALRIYSALYTASRGHPVAALALASAFRQLDRAEDAAAIYQRLRRQSLAPGLGDVGLAEVRCAQEEHEAAWPSLLRAIELRPFDDAVRRLVGELVARGLPEHRLEELMDAVQGDDQRAAQFARGGGAVVLAHLLRATGRPLAARAVLEPELEGELPAPAARRLWGRLLLQTGAVREFLAGLRAGFPAALLADERNQLRGVWLELLEGPWAAAADPLAEAATARGLVHALLRVGLLEEADAVGTLALLRHRGAAAAELRPLRRSRDEARRELAFERAVRNILYQGYDQAEPPPLQQVLRALRRTSRELLGVDVVGEPAVFELPLVGELLDPFAPGLCSHFARYNRHLVLGQRLDRPVEGLLLVRLSLRELDPHPDLPLAGQAFEVIGEDRRIRSLSGIYGGDLAGVALLNHYVVDMDSVRDWAREIAERRRIVREDGGAALTDPLPEELPLLEPASVHWRLGAVSPVPDDGLEDAVLEVIRWHERTHLVDSFHYLPVESNLWRALALLLRHGFSRASIEAEMEARAETAALALSEHTHLVLAHLAVFLEAPHASSPHAVGFRRVARRLAQRLRAAGLPDSAAHWHRLDPERVRALARDMLRDLW